MTRTCLDVLTELQESLANALELTAPVADETDAHFLIRNQLDQQAVVLTNGQYTVSGLQLFTSGQFRLVCTCLCVSLSTVRQIWTTSCVCACQVHGADVEEVVLDQGAEVPLMAKDLSSIQRAASSTAADSKTVRVKVSKGRGRSNSHGTGRV